MWRRIWPYLEIGSAVVGWLCLFGALCYLASRLTWWRWP